LSIWWRLPGWWEMLSVWRKLLFWLCCTNTRLSRISGSVSVLYKAMSGTSLAGRFSQFILLKISICIIVFSRTVNNKCRRYIALNMSALVPAGCSLLKCCIPRNPWKSIVKLTVCPATAADFLKDVRQSQKKQYLSKNNNKNDAMSWSVYALRGFPQKDKTTAKSWNALNSAWFCLHGGKFWHVKMIWLTRKQKALSARTPKYFK